MKFNSILILLLLTNLEFFSIFFLLFFILNCPFSDEEYSFFMKMSEMNFWLMFLVIFIYLMMLMIEVSYKNSLNLLFLMLFMIMGVSDLVSFFLMYEMVFILIMFSIILLGYSYERLMAVYLMLFYSFMFSSPALMLLMILDHSFLMKQWLSYSLIINYFLIGSFMVKFPIFGFHYWLPVAHVEASTIGSMILAGVLLKLGGIGLYYMMMFMNFMVKFHWLVLAVIFVMVMILMLSDLKIMIAYSSVAHMSMVFYILSIGTLIGKKGVIMMMIYHGFISPLMFWVVGMLAWWKTRSLLVIKMMSFSYLFILCIFFLFILNMSFPPFMGFMSEILMLKTLVSNQLILYVMILGVLFSCYYNIYLFWCFNSFMGIVFKLNFFSIDLFMFMLFVFMLNF